MFGLLLFVAEMISRRGLGPELSRLFLSNNCRPSTVSPSLMMPLLLSTSPRSSRKREIPIEVGESNVVVTKRSGLKPSPGFCLELMCFVRT